MDNTVQIEFGTRQIVPELKKIWQICFGDEMEYIDFYFANRFTQDNLLVYLIDKTPVSMLSLLPAALCQDDEMQDIRYVYAVATLPEHRQHGYAGRLIEEAYRRLGVPLVLEPASEALFSYYKKIGFKEAFFIREQTWNMETAAQVKAEQNGQEYWLLTVTPDEYQWIRDSFFMENGYVQWNRQAIEYALKENDFADGYAYKVLHHDREDILLFRQDNDAVHVIETTLSDGDLLAVLKHLRVTDSVTVRRSVETVRSKWNGTAEISADREGYVTRPLGLLLGEDLKQNGYLNLTLE